MKNLTIGFVGLGLIGGSLAKSIRHHFPDFRIIAYNRSENARLAAYADKTADAVYDSVGGEFSLCDYIFLCTPVEYNAQYLRQLKSIIKPTCIITDVGSTKSDIHKVVTEEHMEKNFVGGHPMAGSEKTGYANSSISLLEKALYIITPTSCTSGETIGEYKKLVSVLGSIPIVMDFKEHDYCVAAISHLPHLIAASLVNLVRESDTDSRTMKLLAAGGFKDITRIASSSPEMWQQICAANSENISKLLGDYISYLENIKSSIDKKDDSYILDMFTAGRDYRNTFSD